MTHADYKYIAKELAIRHTEIKSILDTAIDDIISSNNAKILLKDFYIAVGELKITNEHSMKYIFDIKYFRIQPKENSNLMKKDLNKTIPGLKLSSLLKENNRNPLYWYDLHFIKGQSFYEISNNLPFIIDDKEIKKQVSKIKTAIYELRYRELVV